MALRRGCGALRLGEEGERLRKRSGVAGKESAAPQIPFPILGYAIPPRLSFAVLTPSEAIPGRFAGIPVNFYQLPPGFV